MTPRRRWPWRSAAALGLLSLVAACRPGDAPEKQSVASLPADAASVARSDAAGIDSGEAWTTSKASLLDFLHRTYGREAKLVSPWRDGAGEAARELRVCARRMPLADDQPEGLLAVCSQSEFGSGSIDFFQLTTTPNGLRAIAYARNVETGANGWSDARLVRFGARRWGFIDHGGFQAYGTLIGWDVLRAFRGGQLVEVATIHTDFDNDGAECRRRTDCAETKISIESYHQFDAADRHADAWPLVLRQRGVECGQPLDRTLRYDFDAAGFRYPVPDGPPDETRCAGAE